MADTETTNATLKAAAEALYDAGHWVLNDDLLETRKNTAKLWENLRDALGRRPGGTPK